MSNKTDLPLVNITKSFASTTRVRLSNHSLVGMQVVHVADESRSAASALDSNRVESLCGCHTFDRHKFDVRRPKTVNDGVAREASNREHY